MNKLAAQTIIATAGIAGIVYLAAKGHDGWGWLVVLVLLVAG